MSVYRQARQVSPLRVGLIGLVIVAVAIAGVLALRSRVAEGPTDPLAAARSKAQEAAQGLDIFTVEYPQSAQGAERSGALEGLARAQSAWETALPGLAGVDAAAVAQISADLAALLDKAQAGVSADEVIPLAEQTQQAIFALIRASQPAQQTPN